MRETARGERLTRMFAGSVVAMLAVFRVLDILVAHLSALPPSAYEGVAFLDDLPGHWATLVATHLPWWGVLLGIAFLLAAAAADARWRGGTVRRRGAPVFAGWDALDDGAAVRLLVLAITGITTWALAGAPRNLYFDQLHLADRLVLVTLWLAIAWRPIAAVPYAIVAGAIAGQFTVPLGFISWTEMAVLLHLPVLLTAFWIVRGVTGSPRSDVFVFGWCCLVAVTFWTSGLGKLRIEWITHPHIALLMLGAYANGWLSTLDADTMVRAATRLGMLTRPLMVMTLVLECGALVLLWRRWTLAGFFLLATSFHLGVFAMTGICFWKWIAADMAMLVFLVRGQRLSRLPLFTPGRFALSLAVIVASPLWIRAENLTWFDTPLTYSLRFEGVNRRGDTYVLPASFFRPYGDAIVLGTFASISPWVQLTRGMGITSDRGLAEALVAARSPSEVYALERTRGRVQFDSATAAAFDDFVARIAGHARCDGERDPLLIRLLGAPRHLWTLPAGGSFPCDRSLASVRVVEQTSFFDGTRLVVLRRRLLRTVAVSSAARVGPS